MSDPSSQAESKPLAILLMGPTAAGKTELAVELVQRFGCDIISVDSALIYRDMNIGTAKPDAETLRRAPHRLIDILDPAEAYSAAEFRRDALRAMDEIGQQGRTPLLVGGTMLYYKALRRGLAELPPADPNVRAQLDAEREAGGLSAMHARLAAIDPATAARVHHNDPQRIQRALEVHAITGRSITELQRDQVEVDLPWQFLPIILSPPDRTVLHQRIEQRFRQMIDSGFIVEVEQLRARGDLDLSKPAMRAVGYRQVWEYLDANYSFDEMVDRGIIATRQLAKRQMTWLRAESSASWFDPLDGNTLQKVVELVGLRLAQ
jgi:tRNA dimethylallyltransferase